MNPADSWRPAASPASLKARARLLQDIRDFFSCRDILEVETPLLSTSGNTDPEIQSMQTNDGHYLRTSPEFPLKRLLASGVGDIYELGRVFRAGESGRSHNPEFTLLEWYRTACSYHRLMDEVTALVRQCGRGKFDNWTVDKLSYEELFLRHVGVNPFTAGAEQLRRAADKNGIEHMDLNRRQWLDLLLSLVIQPGLASHCLTFVYDFPVDQAALARIRPGSPPVAERFELYLGQVELANGYQELTDAKEQQQRFEGENALRVEQGKAPCAVDNQLLKALQHGMPECSGVALGVDRLLMSICGVDSLSDVLAFPSSRA